MSHAMLLTNSEIVDLKKALLSVREILHFISVWKYFTVMQHMSACRLSRRGVNPFTSKILGNHELILIRFVAFCYLEY